MKTEALFSYQPPFNILAFLILKPASWFLSPRALHSVNVFLIRVTSLPQLVAITIYERHLASGQKIRQSSKDTTQTFFQSLPRHIQNVSLVEALVGPSSSDLYDAIFDMEVGEDDPDLFGDSEDGDDVPRLRSFSSRENVTAFPSSQAQGQGQNTTSDPTPPTSAHPSPGRHAFTKRRTTSTTRLTINPNFSPKGSPRSRPRVLSAVMPTTSTVEQRLGGEGYGAMAPGSTLISGDLYVPPSNGPGSTNNGSAGPKSPLAKFFSQRTGAFPVANEQIALIEANATVKRIESLLEDVKGMPVGKLKDEMKELQVSIWRFPPAVSAD